MRRKVRLAKKPPKIKTAIDSAIEAEDTAELLLDAQRFYMEPEDLEGSVKYAWSLLIAGHHEEAEALLSILRERFPHAAIVRELSIKSKKAWAQKLLDEAKDFEVQDRQAESDSL